MRAILCFTDYFFQKRCKIMKCFNDLKDVSDNSLFFLHLFWPKVGEDAGLVVARTAISAESD